MYIFWNNETLPDGRDIDHDIVGADYEELINVCFRYSALFSFAMANDPELQIPEALVPIACRPHPESEFPHTYRNQVCYYLCTEEAKACLLSTVDDLFRWVSCWGEHRPDDLCFYRKDGTRFFESETHEGECVLHNRDDEDVSSIVSKPGWSIYQGRSYNPWYSPDPEILAIVQGENQ